MSMVFDAYARYYDLLYSDKDYAAEVAYVASHVHEHSPKAKRVLELGCGTGAHAEHLARMGYQVHGVDLSAQMIDRAATRKASLPAEVARLLSFEHGDAREVRTGERYDVVVSLFHVMSYQVANTDLDATFDTVAAHLERGGLFLFDFWYGPAVLTQRPEVRVKRLEDDEIRITRIAEPVMRTDENVVDVRFSVFVEEKASGKVQQVRETHAMRYLFLPEMERYGTAQFKLLSANAWMTSNPLRNEDWSGFVVMRSGDVSSV